MIFNVPQFIDVEDKIAGPFTAKHLLWMFVMGIVLLILWNVLEKGAFVVVAVPVILIFLAMAFYRPYGTPLIKFIFFGITFLFQPKIYSWKRMPQMRKNKPREKNKNLTAGDSKEKKITPQYIKTLAKTIDSEGHEGMIGIKIGKPEVKPKLAPASDLVRSESISPTESKVTPGISSIVSAGDTVRQINQQLSAPAVSEEDKIIFTK